MTDDMDLEVLEKKAWTSMFQDGLWEIIIGLLALTSALGITLDELGASDNLRMAIVYPLLFIGVPILLLGKKYLTLPRTGIVKFSRHRQGRKMVMLAIMLAGFLATMGVWVGITYFNLEGGLIGFATVSILIFTVFCAIAYYLDHKRFYIIAVLMGLGEPMMTYLRAHTDITYTGLIAWGIPGLIILLMGIAAMAQFLKKYPLSEKDNGEETPNAV